jgi:hypothetical protein
MLKAGVGNLCAGKHPRHFMSSGSVIEHSNLSLRSAVIFALLHHQVLTGESGDLRQMCDAEDLLPAT